MGPQIVAYFLLIGLQISALWAPPFRGRAAVFVPAIIACALVLHSSRVGDDPQITYAFGMPWVSYLATIDKLLFTVPELSFWRVGDKKGEAFNYGFLGPEKLRWSAAQYFNPRGVHWNYAVKGVDGQRPKPISRQDFVYKNALEFCKVCLVYDILHTYIIAQYRGVGLSYGDYILLRNTPFLWRFTTTAAAAYVIFSGMQLNHLLASITFVGLGLSEPEDWPPLFGHIKDAFTVRRVWGKLWHKLIRRTLSAYAKFVVRALGIKDATVGAHVHMFVVFFICGVFHAVPLRVMLGEDQRLLPWRTIFFFTSQALAIVVEERVMQGYRKIVGGKNEEPRLWHRLVGFAWVATWMYWALPFLLDDMFASGLMDASSIPFSVARAVAGSFGWPLKA